MGHKRRTGRCSGAQIAPRFSSGRPAKRPAPPGSRRHPRTPLAPSPRAAAMPPRGERRLSTRTAFRPVLENVRPARRKSGRSADRLSKGVPLYPQRPAAWYRGRRFSGLETTALRGTSRNASPRDLASASPVSLSGMSSCPLRTPAALRAVSPCRMRKMCTPSTSGQGRRERHQADQNGDTGAGPARGLA